MTKLIIWNLEKLFIYSIANPDSVKKIAENAKRKENQYLYLE